MPNLYLKLPVILFFVLIAFTHISAQEPLHIKHDKGKILFLTPEMHNYKSIGFAGKNLLPVMAAQPQAYPVFLKYRKAAMLKNLCMAMRLGGAGLMITSFFLTPKTGGTFNYDLYNENTSPLFGTGFILTTSGLLSYIPISILASTKLKKSVKLYNRGTAYGYRQPVELYPVVGVSTNTGVGLQTSKVAVFGAKIAF
ncbi:hypothetical protein C7N43_30370 [Sphingobacteriales bacterium UPWRP_1]|nr:hypothetical protein B6N25_17220 [Sphingobacteriales bacterium TSM_CSS]PSJ73199.1 hypothetical protein C7N43_30370 [Sphingobacteriales bacterium UPWRP_1]